MDNPQSVGADVPTLDQLRSVTLAASAEITAKRVQSLFRAFGYETTSMVPPHRRAAVMSALRLAAQLPEENNG